MKFGQVYALLDAGSCGLLDNVCEVDVLVELTTAGGLPAVAFGVLVAWEAAEGGPRCDDEAGIGIVGLILMIYVMSFRLPQREKRVSNVSAGHCGFFRTAMERREERGARQQFVNWRPNYTRKRQVLVHLNSGQVRFMVT